MDIAPEARALLRRKIVATAAVALWLATLALLSGPARWELAHTYAHWIEGAGQDLPTLTRAIALPVLGLDSPDPIPVGLLYLGCFWLWPVAALWLIWHTPDRERLQELLGLSMALYGALVALLSALLALALWLPFSLL